MFCRKCGKQIPDQSRFCPYCGENIGRIPNETQSRGNSGHTGGTPENAGKSGGQRNLILIVCCGVAAAALILAGMFAALHTVGGRQADGGASSVRESRSGQGAEDKAKTTAGANTLEEREADERTREEEAPVALPPLSAQDDGNLFGNTHCYARIVSDGKNLYFRNPLDQEKTYQVEVNGSQAELFDGIYRKDLHFKDGWIYYSATTPGDVAEGVRDNNIYRIRTDGTGKVNLSQLAFTNEQSWLSFETMADGRSYFVYSDGSGVGIYLGYASDNGGSTIITTIPPELVVDNPCVNVVDEWLYYLAKDGLHRVGVNGGADQLAIPGFGCEEYIIYGGYLYYSLGGARTGSCATVNRMKLDGSGAQELFAPGENSRWIQYIQVNIYRDKLYFIGLSRDPRNVSQGRIYSMNRDGTEVKLLVDRATWFNIIDGTLYYRYVDESRPEQYRAEPFYKSRITALEKAGAGGSPDTELLFDVKEMESAAAKQWPAQAQEVYRAAKPYTTQELEIQGSWWYQDTTQEKRSEFLDRGDYYEVTNCTVNVPYTLPAEIVRQLRVGYSFSYYDDYDEREVHCTVIKENIGDAYSDFELESDYDTGYVVLNPDGTARLIADNNDYVIKKIIYRGSLYFTKDCRAYGFGYPDRSAVYEDMGTYLTELHSEMEVFEYGCREYGISLCGHPVFDANGMITEYREQFYP